MRPVPVPSLSLSTLALAAAVLAFAPACDDAEEGGDAAPAPVSKGKRGESCEFRNDCEAHLACVNEVCILNDYEVPPTAHDCRVIECADADDCCARARPPQCDQLEADCAAGDQFACNQAQQLCGCDDWACEDNVCSFRVTCANDADCPGQLPQCVDRLCRQCASDADCVVFGGGTCDPTGTCLPRCSSRTDCPYFHDCQDGVCVETGCLDDRECMAFLRSPLAICTSGVCSLRCETDAECNPNGYAFQACVDGQCAYQGCNTAEECRIFLQVPPGSDVEVVCD